MSIQENWKDVPGYEGRLQVSTLGRVRSLRVLKASPAKRTHYPVIALPGGKFRGQDRAHVHALVARAFHGPCPEGYEVNHIDACKQNNRPDNLEYVTHKGNAHHAFKVGNRSHYFNDTEMDQIADLYFKDGYSQTQIAWKLVDDKEDIHEMRRIRKKVRSVCEIWRACAGGGRKNPHQPHLTWDDVDRMRMLYAEKKANQRELGKMFNCNPAHVSRIVNGILWPESDRGLTRADKLERFKTRQANHPKELIGADGGAGGAE